jgi:hypothetical protein
MDRIAKRPERSTKKKMGQIAKVLGALETRAQMKIFRKSCETDGRTLYYLNCWQPPRQSRRLPLDWFARAGYAPDQVMLWMSLSKPISPSVTTPRSMYSRNSLK